MIKERKLEVRVILGSLLLVFVVFLVIPLILLLKKSFETKTGTDFSNYIRIAEIKGFGQALANSVILSAAGAVITTVIAFFMAYSIHYTNLKGRLKTIIKVFAVIPMLLPTITYGFAIIYSFGKQGLITKLIGRQLFDIYGVSGLLIGYVIYTIPISFILIHNTMGYVDKKFSVVSRIMGDSKWKTFVKTVLRPLLGTLAASFIQCFFLCFTDFGVPASVGGRVEVIASVLYNQMLGSVPDFPMGAVVAVIMLLPSVISILLLHYIERYNVRYNKISVVEIHKNLVRDIVSGAFSVGIIVCITAVFATIVIVPFVNGWPYDLTFTLKNFIHTLQDKALMKVYFNSIMAALFTAVLGSVMAFGAGLVTARSNLSGKVKLIIDSVATVTNTVPGMVLGIAYMLVFSGSTLQNTFFIIIICNTIHFFATPYTMVKNSLMKMNLSWERTAALMGDNWIKTVIRVIIPNAIDTLIEVFQYYFVNAMVTVSAVIFLAGARTMVITTKIKELQHFAKFDEIFVLSLLILVTNLIVKGITKFIVAKNRKSKNGEKNEN